MQMDRYLIIPLIEKYHAATRASRSSWYAAREELTTRARADVADVIHLLGQPDHATRSIARDKLNRLTEYISARLSRGDDPVLMDIFGWSHFGDMNLYGDDAVNRSNARSFAGVLEPLLGEHFNREAAKLLMVRLYGSNITQIGPGITGLLYFLQPGIFPILGQKALRGFSRLFGKPVRSGKEALKKSEEHLKYIWELVDTCADVIDAKDMADISGFLNWIDMTGALDSTDRVQEPAADYTAGDLKDVPLTLTSEQLRIGIEEISLRLAVSTEAIEQAVINILAGKSLILTGPPGTGKTELARMIPTIFWNMYPMLTTATADWTSFEVIGGLFPQIIQSVAGEQQLGFTIRRGCVYEAVEQNWEPANQLAKAGRQRRVHTVDNRTYDGVWLIIDEFNRADLDKAFGDLFTSLESGELRVPIINDEHGASHTNIPIPQHFRIIGTLNTFDKHHLFEISDALKRRFAFVEINPHPDITLEKHLVLDRGVAEIRKRNMEVDRVKLQTLSDILFDWIKFVRKFRKIGTAQLISVLTYCGMRISFEKPGIPALSEAIESNIVPQLEGLSRDQLEIIACFTENNYEALFNFFEHRLKMETMQRNDLMDLVHFTEYLTEVSSGAQNVRATEIIRSISEGGDLVTVRLIDLMRGDETCPGWHDAFISDMPGVSLPIVGRLIRDIADDTF